MSAEARGGRTARPRGTAPSRGGAREGWARLVVPSQTSFLGLVRDATRRVAEMAGFDEATAQKLALAVDEAATNSIKHAYGGAEDCEVEIRFLESAAELRVEIIDAGRTIDTGRIPQVDLERYASEGRTGGLGVHLMGKIMDSVTFRRASGRNVCCLVKRRPTPGQPPH